jgi:deoxycytidylate deaminase
VCVAGSLLVRSVNAEKTALLEEERQLALARYTTLFETATPCVEALH